MALAFIRVLPIRVFTFFQAKSGKRRSSLPGTCGNKLEVNESPRKRTPPVGQGVFLQRGWNC